MTLKLVAQHADACNVGDDPATVKQKLAVLKQHCETVGRDYESIHRTSSTLCLPADSDEQALALLPHWWISLWGPLPMTILIALS